MTKSEQGLGRKPRLQDPVNIDLPSGERDGEGAEEQIHSIDQRQRRLREILGRILTGDVIPRVFDASVTASAPLAFTDRDTLDAFRALILSGPLHICIEFVQERIDAGASVRDLCLGLFTLSAQELGELWNDDKLSFADVTMGLGRLHKIVHHFSAMDTSLKSQGSPYNIILASAPTEQHAFGVLIVSKIFEMEGWLVTGGPDLHTGGDLVALVRESWFDIIGLSASTPELAKAFEPDIKRLRAASLNPNVYVLVGGNGFADNDDLVEKIGANGVARDADDAIRKARQLLKRRKVSSQE